MTVVKTAIAGLAGAAVLGVAATAMAGGHKINLKSLYRGKTVTILVGYGAGGTYGQTSQLLSRHVGKAIPGKPNVVVQYMPGAGGIKAANYAANVMPGNGLNVFMPPEMTLVSEALRPKKVKFKTTDFNWLGRVFGGNQVMALRRDTGILSVADAKKKSVQVASTGTGSPTFLIPSMMNGLLGTNFKLVKGYKGSAKTTMSVEQGETLGMSNSWVSWTKNRGPWFKGGNKSFMVPIAQIGFSKEPDLPNVPLLTDLAQSETDKAAAAMLSTASIIGRGLVLPPNSSKALIKPLRGAFWKAVSSKAFKDDTTKRGLVYDPIKGEEIQAILVKTRSSLTKEVVVKAQKVVFGK
ncbi:MAG: Bug family tripartite tricarboxylate transporter substrate binding protein [Alphaproteobacteria bacterium]